MSRIIARRNTTIIPSYHYTSWAKNRPVVGLYLGWLQRDTPDALPSSGFDPPITLLRVLDQTLFMIFSHIVAALSALIRSIQYAGVVGISKAELLRYVKKSVRLALCYAGFGTPWNLMEGWKAGEAAFLSCAYDVVTDWRHFDEEARSAFETILTDLSRPELRELALTLYDKDLTNRLSEDGLERGAIALRFILKTMGCEAQREAAWGNLDDLGELLQIVDDVLDYEDDAAVGDQNCLRTANRAMYLNRLLEGLSRERTRRLFGRTHSVLVLAIAHARKKGAELRAQISLGKESEVPRSYSI